MFSLLLGLSLAFATNGAKRTAKNKTVAPKEDDSSMNYIIGGGVLAFGAYIVFRRTSKEDDGLISDKNLTTEDVLRVLENFQPQLNEKLKYGYTEKSVGKQLFQYLNEHFETVAKEYSIGGNRSTKVDFCIGNVNEGMLVGIELKILSALFKSAGLQRLYGQIADYKTLFTDENLVVLAVGENNDFEENASVQEVKDRVSEQSVHLQFSEIPSKIMKVET